MDFELFSGLASHAALAAAVLVSLAVALALAALALKTWFGVLPDGRGRIGHIDGLRGYLALCVVVHHFVIWQRVIGGRPWEAPPVHLLNNLGQSAVFLFFMVTGALFYDRVVAAAKTANWINVYTSRVFRLTPLYWFAVMVVVAIALARVGTAHGGILENLAAVGHWLFYRGMPDVGGYERTAQIIAGTPWTLRYEWRFYLALPFLYAGYRLLARLGVPAVPVIGVALLLGALYPAAFKFVTPFVFGMLAIEIARSVRARRLLSSPLAAVIGVAALVTQMTVYANAMGFAQHALLAVFFVPVVAGNSYFGSLSLKTSEMLGEASYSIYLLHGIVLSLFMVEVRATFGLSTASAFLPLLVAVVVTLALATNHWIEQPGIGLGKRVAAHLNGMWARRLDRARDGGDGKRHDAAVS